MARFNTNLLDTGDKFPQMTLKLINGELITLPDDTGDCYSVIFFYRGYW